ncbi:sugar transferase [Leptospira santarosai]|uniref:sugar transferase n=1 Tax=Leptospira santarosai TaxID=28183 RepID=UPI0024AED7DD|nr:sugar transferase [Leptospira santarosai]MDI7185169.1 sugar transferase [Leptospira santarosai]MDI7199211.1 sugar transferase [Leptospira santarosai]
MISLSRWSKFFDMKRMIEASLAAVALVLFSPVLVGVSLLILIIDGRPIFFLQERIGLNRKPFRIVKFRTMKDGVITHLGSWLRNGIDELPQIWNILIGDMSIVGPRPLTQYDIDRLGWNQKFYDNRWDILPGITGLAQLYSGMGVRVSFCFDRSYFKRKSFGLDVRIVLFTFAMNVFGRKRIRDTLKRSLKERRLGVRWKGWSEHFRKNESRPLPKIDAEVLKLRPNEMQSIAYSLAIFQLGESGEGRISKEIDKTILFGIDDFYRQALKLFVKEEGMHARILGECVRALKGEPIESNWTERLFYFGRRLLGVRLKLMVLLAAEVVGICFYKKIAEKIPNGLIKSALLDIVRDEEKHLKFHGDFFRIRVRNFFTKFIFRWLWRAVAFAACITVILDHRKTFRVLGISNWKTFQKFQEIARSAEDCIVSDRNLNRSLSLIRISKL